MPFDARVAFARQRQQRQREFTTGVRRHFFKSVLPRALADGGEGRGRGDAAASAGDTAAAGASLVRAGAGAGAATAAAAAATATSAAAAAGRAPPQASAGHKRARAEDGGGAAARPRLAPPALPAEIAGDRPKARKMARLLAQPSRFTPALRQALTAADARDAARAAAAAAAAAEQARQAQRKRLAKQYAQRSRTGQPIMAHRAKELLRKVERSVKPRAG